MDDPDNALTQADRLAAHTRTSARWLARYYVIFGVASLLMPLGFGLLHEVAWTITLLMFWLALIVGISIYAGRQPTMVQGGGRIHAAVMVAWTVIWVTTVTVGSSQNLPWPWWLAGGVGMLAAALLGARAVQSRTRGPT